jgi:excisionase family DNA binding protein
VSAHPDSTDIQPTGGRGRIAYTVAEVAAMLGKHPNTIYEWVQRGALPAEKLGGTIYIPKWALARLLSPAAHDEPAPAAARAGAGGGVA